MKAHHTPGPWEIQTYSNYIGFAISAGEYGCLAERWYKEGQSEERESQMKANALLISLAPELLELLEEIYLEVIHQSWQKKTEKHQIILDKICLKINLLLQKINKTK